MSNFADSDVVWLDTVDSTINEIKRRVESFNKTTWVVSNIQTNGRGRNGNSWLGGKGNFSGSVIFFPSVVRAYFHIYGFFFGVALYNVVKNIVKEGIDVRLKWPNDLMIENRKVGGILLESVQVSAVRKMGLIVGIGVNLISAPKLTKNATRRYETECIANFSNNKIDQSMFFGNFSDELIKLEAYVGEKNLSSILNIWQLRTYDKGTKISISNARGKVQRGTFLGLDDIGGLIIGENSGVKKVYSGDVYFGS